VFWVRIDKINEPYMKFLILFPIAVLVLTVFALIGSADKVTNEGPWVDPQLRPYVEEYLKDMKDYGINTEAYMDLDSIVLLPTSAVVCNEDEVIGCYDPRKNKVSIKRPTLADYRSDSVTYYKWLTYHELGHGIFKSPHNTFRMSLMNISPILPMSMYKDMWPLFRKEYVSFIKAGINIHEFKEW
jgi:hypothetical protein